MPVDARRIRRYRSQSLRLLDDALENLRAGRWSRAEDLLWGSLTQAVKGLALSRGVELDSDDAVREYAAAVGRETRDSRVRDSFDRLRLFGEVSQGIRDSRTRVDRLFPIFQDINDAVARLWDMAPDD